MKNILVIVLIILDAIGFTSTAFSQTTGVLDPTFASAGELGDSAIFPFRYSGLALASNGTFVVSSASHDTIQVIRYTATGARDLSFGVSGISYLVVSGFSGTVTTSAIQADNKILIAGQYQYGTNAPNKKAYIMRLNADGTLDNGFGTNGWVLFSQLPHFGETIHQISLQQDGKIVALDMGNNPGNTDTIIIARLKTNGTYDSAFAVNGKYQLPLNNFLATSPNLFNIDANNNIAFAGYSNYQGSDYLYQLRLNSSGTLDATFGNNGTIFIDSTNIINGGANLGLNFQSDGKLITVQSKQTGSILWAVCRYNTNGSIDQNFGTNGMVQVQPNLLPVPYSVTFIAETNKNTILIGGIVSIGGALRLIVCNFNNDGSVDASFGNNQGSTLLNCFELDDYMYNMLLQSDGGILINGMINEQNYQFYEVARLTAANPTGVKQIDDDIEFSVFPNPANSEVHFELSKPALGTISLKDMTGKLVFEQQLVNTTLQTLNISKLPSGIYVVTYRDNETMVSKRFIKE